MHSASIRVIDTDIEKTQNRLLGAIGLLADCHYSYSEHGNEYCPYTGIFTGEIEDVDFTQKKEKDIKDWNYSANRFDSPVIDIHVISGTREEWFELIGKALSAISIGSISGEEINGNESYLFYRVKK